MTGPRDELETLFREIDRTPWGPKERELVATAVRWAVDAGDEQLEYQARMRQTNSANMAGDTDLMLSSFAWCLAKHDADPHRFPADLGEGTELMWQFKWMAGALRDSPHFSLDQVGGVLADMEEHYRRAGLGPGGVLMARFESAWSTGRLGEAEQLRRELDRTPRDSHSHCEACVRSQMAAFFVETGRDGDAIRLVTEMLDGGLTCAEEPEHALSRILLPYLRADQPAAAKAAHLRSYRLAKDDPDGLSIVAGNIVFAAVTGNTARALAMVERHIGWLGHDNLNDAAHLRALAAFALALDTVTDQGHGATPVRGSDDPRLVRFIGEHQGLWHADELATAMWDGAALLAALFDARNGNDAATRSLDATRALRHEHFDLPIRSDSQALVTAPASTATAQQRRDRAIALADWGEPETALEAARTALADADPDDEAALRAITVAALVAMERLAEAEAEVPLRVAALRRAGEHVQADIEEQLGLAAFGRMEPEDIAALEAAAATEQLPDTTRGDLFLGLASVGVTIDDFEAATTLAADAAAAFDRAGLADRTAAATLFLAMLQEATGNAAAAESAELVVENEAASLGARARALELRARLREADGSFDDAAGDADAAMRAVGLIGARTGMAALAALAGSLHLAAGSGAAAVARYRLAVQAGQQEQVPDLLSLRFRLGTTLLDEGEAAEAADILSEVLQAENAAGAPPRSLAQVAAALGHALEATGDPGAAADAWSMAVQLFERAGEAVPRATAMVKLAYNLSRIGEQDTATTLFQDAIPPLRAAPRDDEMLMRALHLQAQHLIETENPTDAYPLLDEAAEFAAAAEDEWTLADLLDTRARVAAQLGDIDGAIALALRAADSFAAHGFTGETARGELFAARLLASVDRHSDSVPVYRSVLERSEDTTVKQVAALELGEVLTRLGRHAEAAEVRRIADQND